jgi:hypothetical protein
MDITVPRCVVVRCGHAMHQQCLEDSLKHGDPFIPPRCPICRKCLLTHAQSKPYWDALRLCIKLQPPHYSEWRPDINERYDDDGNDGDGINNANIIASVAEAEPLVSSGSINDERDADHLSTTNAMITRSADCDGTGTLLTTIHPPTVSPPPATEDGDIDVSPLMCNGGPTGLGSSQMPLSYLREEHFVDIFCHDCEVKSHVRFHWLGLECAYCEGFNTARA